MEQEDDVSEIVDSLGDALAYSVEENCGYRGCRRWARGVRVEAGELVADFIFAFRDEETASDAERDIDDDLGLLVHDPEIEIEGALVIAMSPVKGGDFGLNRLGLLEFIVRERSELTPGPTPEAAPLRSGDDHGEDTLPTPPEKTELKYSNLGSKLDRLIGRIEAGEISALDAAGNAPIHQDESVAVTIYLSGNAKEVVDFLKQNDGEVGNVGDDYIEAYVPVLLLGKTSDQPGVLRVREIIPPHQTHGDSTSQGVSVHGSQSWNKEGYEGQGIKVGVIDVGFEGFSDLLGTELPASVEARCYFGIFVPSPWLTTCERVSSVVGFFTGLGDHGTRVAEAIIDIAPEASLYIANPQTPGDLQKTVQWMIQEGVSVINYSRGWFFSGPGDGTSPFADDPLRTVDQAIEEGIVWVNAAGNEARKAWFGTYSDPDKDGYINFDDSSNDESNGLRLRKGDILLAQLRWDDTWGGATRDLDLFLVSDSTNAIVARSEDTQSGNSGDVPLEWLVFLVPADGQYSLTVARRGGSVPDWIQLVVPLGPDSIEHSTARGSINSPGESSNPGMVAVGAAPWYDTYAIENYSSRGPTPDGRIKPDLVGATCGESALKPLRLRRGFCGTSQAAPHVAGMVALVRQRFPQYGPEEVVEYLKGHAERRGDENPDNTWGHGFAALPTPGEDCRQTLGLGSISGEWARGCVSAVPERGHARYYTFALGSQLEVILTLESDDADAYLYLREGPARSGQPVHENNDYGTGTDSRIVVKLDAGIYTVEATTNSAGRTGSFTLTIDVRRSTPEQPTTPEKAPPRIVDDHGDDIPDATYVSLGDTLNGDIEHEGDVDLFSFRAQSGYYYAIRVRHGTNPDTILTLLDSDGRFITEDDDSGGDGEPWLEWAAPSSGIYYVEVRGFDSDATGTYRIEIDESDPESTPVLWSYETGGGVYSSPAVAGGVVYVGSADSHVYALDGSTGELIWSYETGSAVFSSPAVSGGVVYVGSWDNRVYALDASTGDLIWSYETGAYVLSSPAVSGGVVYVGSVDGRVYALDASTGDLIWSYETDYRVLSSPTVAGGVVYVGDGRLYALDASTGERIWSYGTGDRLYSSPAVSGGVVYMGSLDNRVYALDASTGDLIWSYETDDEVWSSPEVSGGVVYVGSEDHRVYALDASTGDLIWSYETGDRVNSSPAVSGGVVYVGSNDNRVYALDRSTGDLIWSYETGDEVLSSPEVSGGVVYVGSDDARLYALDASPNTATFLTEAQKDPADLFEIDVQVQPSSPSVGGEVTITAVATGKGGLPQYSLSGELEPILELQSEGAVDFNVFGKAASWKLLAKETGTVEIVVNVNYETSAVDQDGRTIFSWTRDSSEPITIVVGPR